MKGFMQEFLEDTKEQITKLNNYMIELESNPENEKTIKEIFRIAHTIKGNSASVGLNKISELAHAMEDLFDDIRNEEVKVTSEIMDSLFKGLDMIESMVSELENQDEIITDPNDLMKEIRSYETGDSGQPQEETHPEEEQKKPKKEEKSQELNNSFNIKMKINPNSQMRNVDAQLILSNLEEFCNLKNTTPTREEIEDGNFEEEFKVLVNTNFTEKNLKEKIDKITRLESYKLTQKSKNEGKKEKKEKVESSKAKKTISEQTIQSVRVDVDQLDKLMSLVEELVIEKLKLNRYLREGSIEDARRELDSLDKGIEELQDIVMDSRLVPLRRVLDRFPRLVRDLGRDMDKEVNLEIEDGGVEVDRDILAKMDDPLMHLIRNSIDHGIEDPEVRKKKGKPSEGTIKITANQRSDHVVITVEDDGAGMDLDVIKEKAVKNDVISQERAESIDDEDAKELIFRSGFSTTDEVSDVSGRGVGMDVVSDTVKSLNGTIEVETEEDEGTAISLVLPVTMAIVEILIVEAEDRSYGIPIRSIERIMKANKDEVREVGDRKVISLEEEEEVLPILELANVLGMEPKDKKTKNLIKIRNEERKIGIICDDIDRQEEVVIKPFSGILSGIDGLNGAAILGEGIIVPIIDVKSL